MLRAAACASRAESFAHPDLADFMPVHTGGSSDYTTNPATAYVTFYLPVDQIQSRGAVPFSVDAQVEQYTLVNGVPTAAGGGQYTKLWGGTLQYPSLPTTVSFYSSEAPTIVMADAKHRCRYRVVSALGTSSWSLWSNHTMPGYGYSMSAPIPLEELSGSLDISTGNVDFSWDPYDSVAKMGGDGIDDDANPATERVPNIAALEYEIWALAENSGSTDQTLIKTVSGAVTDATVTDLVLHTYYQFQLRVKNTCGLYSAFSETIRVQSDIAQPAPGAISVTKNGMDVTIGWAPATATGGTPITGYGWIQN